ncbi:MAG TPA: MFS transporter [Candidatus Paceibacterota bacterium]|nr:MFS transporter [Candidatus Paceibacterota bacterium]
MNSMSDSAIIYCPRSILERLTYASAIALSFAVLDASNPTALGLIFVAREVPILVLLLVGGVLADRFPRRFVLAGASFVAGASQLVAAAILIHGSPSIFALACCVAVNGAAGAFSRPAITGLVPQIVSTARLQQANALLGLAPRMIGIVGAALGSWLITSIGSRDRSQTPWWATSLGDDHYRGTRRRDYRRWALL